jgi:regulator of sigma E protease
VSITSIIWVVVFISVLIIIHEFGHLIVAKLSRIAVEVFSVGFGPILLKKKIGETEYRLSLIPLGGFIKMVGEEEHAGPAPEIPAAAGATGVGFMDKPFGIRAAVIAAGPVFNLVLGFLMLFVMYLAFGVKYVKPVVAPLSGSNATAAGFVAGDTVLFVGGETIPSFDQLDAVLARSAGTPTTVIVQHNGRRELSYAPPKDSADLNPVLPAVIDRVRGGSPAARLGLKPGDVITAVAGKPVTGWEDFVSGITAKPGERVAISWTRGGQAFTDSITPASERDQLSDQRVGQVGVWVQLPKRNLSVPVAAWEAAKRTGYVVVQTFVIIWKVITRQISTKAIGGPIMVAKIAYEGANWGAEYFIALWALLSINLFVVNMLPVPVLDGGRILLDAIGTIRRRKLSLKEMTWAANIGWAMIGLLVLFTIFNDILRLIRR